MTFSLKGCTSSLLLLLPILSLACAPVRESVEGVDNDDSAKEVLEEAPPDPSQPCAEGEVDDCESLCAPEAWLGDGECDQAFNCEEFIFDYGDCFFEE